MLLFYNKSMKKNICLFFLIILLPFYMNAQVVNDSQIIEGNHWIYDAFNMLALETTSNSFTNNSPVSAGELKLYLKNYDKESLSDNGKEIYDEIEAFLYTKKNFFPDKAYEAVIGLTLAPEVNYKSNENIAWTNRYNYKSFPLIADFDSGFSNYVSAGADFFIGKNYKSANKPDSFTNLPLAFDEIEFMFPRFCYGSAGKTFDNWGFNVNVGKEGLKIGNTQTGSIIYNNTFETDGYIQLSAFTDDYKFTLDIIEVSQNKFLYWHQFDARLWKKFKISVMEGALINEPFEIRFINPFMVFHSFSFWKNYSTDVENHFYNESHCCAFLGVSFEYNPIKYLRLYGLYAMNEMQLPNERYGSNLAYPDSFGLQFGAELKIPSSFGGYWNSRLESVYCSPYLYVKQAPEWSLYKTRMDMITFSDVNSWIGSPFGPDCFVIDASFGYEKFNKWSCSLGYQMLLKGENDFNLFNKKLNYISTKYKGDDTELWSYYPYTEYMLARDEGNEEGMERAVNKAQDLWMSGCHECTHKIALNGMYAINENMKLEGQFMYLFIVNAAHISGNFQHGLQTAISFQYKVF